MNILIVDDNPVTQKLMVEMLSRYGNCQVAADGESAVAMFIRGLEEGNSFELVCLDIMIPKLDGQQVLQRIRDAEKEKEVLEACFSKIMMVTSLDDSENIMQAFTKGHCDAYVMKPVNRAKLGYHLRDMKLVK